MKQSPPAASLAKLAVVSRPFKEVTMTVYCGVDFHARSQSICYCDTADGEVKFRELHHQTDEVREFYRHLEDEVIVGWEASGYSHWFESMLGELGHEVWVGDATEIRRLAKRRQKNDRRDAEHILDLMLKGEFPRVHRYALESQVILRQLRYRHKVVKHTTMVKNSLRAITLGAGLPMREKLTSKAGQAKLRALSLPSPLDIERDEWWRLLDQLEGQRKAVEKRLHQTAKDDVRVPRLMTHPGVGLLTALCVVHALGPVERFATTCKVAAFAGLEPMEHSSGETKRYGSISKAGNRLLRFLLGEAAQMVALKDDQLRSFYLRLKQKRGTAKAVMATARKLLIRLFIMLRDEIDYAEFRRRGVEVRSARVFP
jgi:transposase